MPLLRNYVKSRQSLLLKVLFNRLVDGPELLLWTEMQHSEGFYKCLLWYDENCHISDRNRLLDFCESDQII